MAKRTDLRYWRRMLWLMGWFKIPLIAFVSPRLQCLDDEKAVLTIRLRRRTRNHLKSMYFGALAVGADVAAGLHAFYFCEKEGVKPSFAFRSMQAEFHRRATSTVMFTSDQGAIVEELVKVAITTGERQHAMIPVTATDENGEVVAIFRMEISVKIVDR